MAVVVDASFVMATLADEDHTDYARAAMPDLFASGIAAPALILWEVTNIHHSKRRRGLLSEIEALEGLEVFLSFPIELDAERGALGDVLERARLDGLSAYDAAYLELATRLGAGLATLDRPLAKAGLAAGLTVISPFA